MRQYCKITNTFFTEEARCCFEGARCWVCWCAVCFRPSWRCTARICPGWGLISKAQKGRLRALTKNLWMDRPLRSLQRTMQRTGTQHRCTWYRQTSLPYWTLVYTFIPLILVGRTKLTQTGLCALSIVTAHAALLKYIIGRSGALFAMTDSRTPTHKWCAGN